jgi:hypothetical protein
MGAQASRLMLCFFQDCCCAPEGGVPAYTDVACIAGRV